MSQIIATGGSPRLILRMLCGIIGLSLFLPTADLQQEFISTSRAAPRPPPTLSCRVAATDIAPEIMVLARDIGRRFHLAQSAAHSITSAAFTAAQLRGIDPTLVLAVAAVESKFKPRAVNSSTGAKGLMQVVAKWHPDEVEGVGGEPSLLLIAPNINVGAAILAEYVDAEDGNITGALGHYLGASGAETYVRHVRLEMAHLARVLKSI